MKSFVDRTFEAIIDHRFSYSNFISPEVIEKMIYVPQKFL